jgi:hypothetical protein
MGGVTLATKKAQEVLRGMKAAGAYGCQWLAAFSTRHANAFRGRRQVTEAQARWPSEVASHADGGSDLRSGSIQQIDLGKHQDGRDHKEAETQDNQLSPCNRRQSPRLSHISPIC